MKLFAAALLTPRGWIEDALIEIAADGTIVDVKAGATPEGAHRAAGPVVPGIPNVHSHAFQRAIAGRTGHAAPQGDSFWTWRHAMYAFLDRVDADAFAAIAAEAYVEMLKAGYTSVAEFHYVHHDREGQPYQDRAELSRRIVEAAHAAGIGLTLLPVYYAHAGFGGVPPTAAQRRFVQSTVDYARLIEILARDAALAEWTVGVAPHSLRAVTPEELASVVGVAPHNAPIHIHVAEQIAEVVDCVGATGARPVEWLLDHADVGARWCIVHATHMTSEEAARLAASGAVVGLAPTTEADLGDGTFMARAYVDAGGVFGVGSDSNTVIDPFVELRQLEWSQRLSRQARNVLSDKRGPVGLTLYASAARGGAQALGRNAGRIEAGCLADLVVLNTEDPGLAGQSNDALLDAAIFGPCRRPVRDVMVRGRWVVRDGHHLREDEVLARYRATLTRMES